MQMGCRKHLTMFGTHNLGTSGLLSVTCVAEGGD